MASKAKDTIIVRVKSHTKRVARRQATADGVTLTQYIISLIHADELNHRVVPDKP